MNGNKKKRIKTHHKTQNKKKKKKKKKKKTLLIVVLIPSVHGQGILIFSPPRKSLFAVEGRKPTV